MRSENCIKKNKGAKLYACDVDAAEFDSGIGIASQWRDQCRIKRAFRV